MLEWLADNVSVFKMQHNAHHEFHMDVRQYLAHRTRIGNSPMFLNPRDGDISISQSTLWELQVILPDSTMLDIAGSNLENCISAVQNLVARRVMAAAA